jgi:polysaccharide export outer membrane protein
MPLSIHFFAASHHNLRDRFLLSGVLMRRLPIIAFMGSIMAAGAVSGCTMNPPPLAASESVSFEDAYQLGTGDKLRISVYNEPDLTGEYNVTTSGTVAFPLIGSVTAKGKTIEALGGEITSKLSGGYIKDPKVSVEVLNYRPFYILGEVNKPGEYPYVSGMTIQQAVATAGGFSYRANEKTLFLRRARRPDERSVLLKEKPIPVLPGDTIRVGQRYF